LTDGKSEKAGDSYSELWKHKHGQDNGEGGENKQGNEFPSALALGFFLNDLIAAESEQGQKADFQGFERMQHQTAEEKYSQQFE